MLSVNKSVFFLVPAFLKALDKALSARGTAPSELVRIVESLESSIHSHGQYLDYESKCLLKYCHAQGQLLAVFTDVQRLHGHDEEKPAVETKDISQEVGN